VATTPRRKVAKIKTVGGENCDAFRLSVAELGAPEHSGLYVGPLAWLTAAVVMLRRDERNLDFDTVKVKFSHTRYRALGPKLIPVYWQSARR